METISPIKHSLLEVAMVIVFVAVVVLFFFHLSPDLVYFLVLEFQYPIKINHIKGGWAS